MIVPLDLFWRIVVVSVDLNAHANRWEVEVEDVSKNNLLAQEGPTPKPTSSQAIGKRCFCHSGFQELPSGCFELLWLNALPEVFDIDQITREILGSWIAGVPTGGQY